MWTLIWTYSDENGYGMDMEKEMYMNRGLHYYWTGTDKEMDINKKNGPGHEHTLLLDRRIRLVKGIVQRKLRQVEIGINREVWLQCWGAGHYFLILKGQHLVFRIKRFAAT